MHPPRFQLVDYPFDTAPSRGSGGQLTTTESYTYDADGQRVTRTANGITTLYLGGIFEQDIQVAVAWAGYAVGGSDDTA